MILNAYMKGGSTLLGTLFDENDDAFYWFEAIFNIYASMMAAKMNMHPLKMYYTSEGKPRYCFSQLIYPILGKWVRGLKLTGKIITMTTQSISQPINQLIT